MTKNSVQVFVFETYVVDTIIITKSNICPIFFLTSYYL